MNARQSFLRHMLRELLIKYSKDLGLNTTLVDEFLDSSRTNILGFIEVIDGEDFRRMTTLIEQFSGETPNENKEEDWPLN